MQIGAEEESVYYRKVREAKLRILAGALRDARGNSGRAAEQLGIHRNTFARQLREMGVGVVEMRRQVRITKLARG